MGEKQGQGQAVEVVTFQVISQPDKARKEGRDVLRVLLVQDFEQVWIVQDHVSSIFVQEAAENMTNFPLIVRQLSGHEGEIVYREMSSKFHGIISLPHAWKSNRKDHKQHEHVYCDGAVDWQYIAAQRAVPEAPGN
jgi:hypothetical protein